MSDMDERARFDAWLAGQAGRVTGWTVWRASLALRDYPAENSRGAFDRWLAGAIAHNGRTGSDWDLFEAWQAGADYVHRIMSVT